MVAGGAEGDGGVCRIHRPRCAVLRGAFHALRGGRLAAGGGTLGTRAGDGGRAGGAAVRVRGTGAEGDRVVYGSGERAVAAGDGEAGNDPKSGGRLRPSADSRGASAAEACAVPDCHKPGPGFVVSKELESDLRC